MENGVCEDAAQKQQFYQFISIVLVLEVGHNVWVLIDHLPNRIQQQVRLQLRLLQHVFSLVPWVNSKMSNALANAARQLP